MEKVMDEKEPTWKSTLYCLLPTKYSSQHIQQQTAETKQKKE